MEAFELMVTKDNGLYSAIPDFMRKIWSAVKDVVDSVSAKVSSCVTRLRALSTSPHAETELVPNMGIAIDKQLDVEPQ